MKPLIALILLLLITGCTKEQDWEMTQIDSEHSNSTPYEFGNREIPVEYWIANFTVCRQTKIGNFSLKRWV